MVESIKVLTPTRERFYWTLDHDTVQTGRYVHQTGGPGKFAVVRLRFQTDFDGPGVVLANEVVEEDFPHDDFELAEIVDAISQGVLAGLSEASPDSEPIQALKITVMDIAVQPIDTLPQHFIEAAQRGVQQAVDEAGLVYIRPS
jgi:Elongation factor G, domain IV